jgi:anti-sigma regulatory factor (Ser/Thr protein kinase)
MILNYSRLQVGQFPNIRKRVALSPICLNLVSEYSSAAKLKSLEFSFQDNCGDSSIFVDEYSITMAISNLIENAIKFTNKGFVVLNLHLNYNDDIILDLKDSGIGIEEKYIDKIFEPYQQEQMGYGRTYEGIGLGLAMVKKVLDLNDAIIHVNSKKGEGATFSINFGKAVQPADKIAETVKSVNSPPAPEQNTNEEVLIVEDDLLNRLTINRFLAKRYNTILTDSSDKALEILKKQKVDIILMDISINGKKNGLELTRELKA